MTRPPDIHVVTDAGRLLWKLMQGGRTLSWHLTQHTAIRLGRRIAQRDHVDLVTHAVDGRIRSKDSYGDESARQDTEH